MATQNPETAPSRGDTAGMSLLLGNVVTEYEKRFGPLNIESTMGGEARK